MITRTLTLILGHTLTVTGPLPQWRSKGGPPRAAKLRLYLKIWKSILKGRNFRKGLQKSRRRAKNREDPKKVIKKFWGMRQKSRGVADTPARPLHFLLSLSLSLSLPTHTHTHPLSLDPYKHKHSLPLCTLTLYLSTHSLYLATTHSLDLSFSLYTHTLSLLLSFSLHTHSLSPSL